MTCLHETRIAGETLRGETIEFCKDCLVLLARHHSPTAAPCGCTTWQVDDVVLGHAEGVDLCPSHKCAYCGRHVTEPYRDDEERAGRVWCSQDHHERHQERAGAAS